MSLPILTIIGNIQRIETKQIPSGKSITTINVSSGEKNSKGEYDNLYIKADFWEKQSDFVSKYFKEGDAIIVTGKLVTTNYQKQDGTKVYETKFLFPQASFVPKSRDTQQQSQQQYQQNTPQQPAPQPAPQPQYQQQNTGNPPPVQQGAISTQPIPSLDISEEIPF